jgi:hypothetical protein
MVHTSMLCLSRANAAVLPVVMTPRETRAENKLWGSRVVCVCVRMHFVGSYRMWVAFRSWSTGLRTRSIVYPASCTVRVFETGTS